MKRFSYSFVSVRFVAKRYILQQVTVSEEVNRKLRARNTLIQLLALYTDLERNNTQPYGQKDRQPIVDHTV